MTAINHFLLANDLRITTNPCVSPDFCLDWPALTADLQADRGITPYPHSQFQTADGFWTISENTRGDHAWVLQGAAAPLEGPVAELSDGRKAYPASWKNLLVLKNQILEFDPESTIFPSTRGNLGRSTIGVGARFTTLHWPGVDWAMAWL